MSVATGAFVANALYYLEQGFSVFPLQPKDKVPYPGFKWGIFQRRLPTEDEIREWGLKYPDANIALVCGQVSGGIVVYDVDSREFCAWMVPNLHQLGTLVIETGSGKLHVYMRSKIKTKTAPQDYQSQRLADVKAEGSYVLAPPSIHPDTGKPYFVLQGSFERIRDTPDARELCDRVYERFVGKTQGDRESDTYTDRSILTPLDPVDKDNLSLLIRGLPSVSNRVKRAIASPVTLGSPEWPSKSYSEVDFAVCEELLKVGLPDETIEQVFANFPIGWSCYANTSRSNHGRGYLSLTLDNVRKLQDKRANARIQDIGVNFKVLDVRLIVLEDPLYEITVETGGRERVVGILGSDLFSRTRTMTALGVALNFVPIFRADLRTAEGWLRFPEVIMDLAEREEVPPSATEMGLLRHYAISAIRDPETLDITEPPTLTTVRYGWRDDVQRVIYVSGPDLVLAMKAKLRPAPPPEDVWQIIRSLDGQHIERTLSSGERASLWVIPFANLGW